jgi:fumarate reductase subunit C
MPQGDEHIPVKAPAYTEYHPRWYRPQMSTYWWLWRGSYLAFILRELSSVFIAWFVVYLLLLVHAVSQEDPRFYKEFLDWSGSPGILLLNLVSLCFVVFHAVTWFNLAPKAMAVRLRGKRVPALLIAGPNYVAWVVVSAVVAWLLLRG